MKSIGLDNGSNKNTGSGNGGGSKNKNKNKNVNFTNKGNGEKTRCGICKKFHLGKCRYDDGNGNDIRKQNNNNNNNNNNGKGYKKTGFSKRQFETLKMMTGTSNTPKRKYDGEGSDEDGWKTGYAEAEQMYIACRLGQADDDDMSINLTEARKLKREAKKAYKRLKRN